MYETAYGIPGVFFMMIKIVNNNKVIILSLRYVNFILACL